MAFLARAASRGLWSTGRPPRVLSSVAGVTIPPPPPPNATSPPLTAGLRQGLTSPPPPPPSAASVAGGFSDGGGAAAGGGLPAAFPGDAPPAAGVDVGAAAASGAGAFGDVGAGVSGGAGAATSPGAGGPALGGPPHPPAGEGPATAGGDEDHDDGDGVVRELVHAAMHHVPAHGWTAAAIAAGAADMGLPPSSAGLLPGGGAELLAHFLLSVNARVAEQMRDGGPLAAVVGRPVDRVHAAVMGRLALLAPVKGRWGEALALGGRPDAVGGTVRATAEFVDEVWAYAGDVSTDVRFAAEWGGEGRGCMVAVPLSCTRTFQLAEHAE